MRYRIALDRGLVAAGSLLLAVFASACTIPDGEVVSEGEYLVYEAIGRGNTGLAADSLVRVIRDEETWMAFRDSLTAPEPFEEVDFEQMMVIAIALPRTYGGYGIEVSSVEQRPDGVLVEYEVSEPASDCMTVMGASLPFEVVKVRKAEGPIRFERTTFSYRCTWKQ